MLNWPALFTLTLIYAVNQWDRYLLNNLAGARTIDCNRHCSSNGIFIDQCGRCQSQQISWANADVSTCASCQTCLDDNRARRTSMAYGTCLTGEEFGILTGLGFTGLYVLTAVIAGRLVDSIQPHVVLQLGLCVWSLATAAQALTHNFAGLFAVRLVQGAAEAVAAPASYAIVALITAPEQRGLANGVFSVGVYAGGSLASFSIVLARAVGWRPICVGLGVLGLLLACLLCCQRHLVEVQNHGTPSPTKAGRVEDGIECSPQGTDTGTVSLIRDSSDSDGQSEGEVQAQDVNALQLAEPNTQPGDEVQVQSPAGVQSNSTIPDGRTPAVHCAQTSFAVPVGLAIRDAIEAAVLIGSSPRSLLLLAGSSARFFGGYAIGSFLGRYLTSVFPGKAAEYSLGNAAVIGLGGAAAAVLGGWAADSAARWAAARRQLGSGSGVAGSSRVSLRQVVRGGSDRAGGPSSEPDSQGAAAIAAAPSSAFEASAPAGPIKPLEDEPESDRSAARPLLSSEQDPSVLHADGPTRTAAGEPGPVVGSIAGQGQGQGEDSQMVLPDLARAAVPALSGLLAVPCMLAVLLTPSLETALAALAAEYLLAEGWFGPVLTMLLGSLPKRVHGSAVAVFVVCTTVVGSIAPLVLGIVWDRADAMHGSGGEAGGGQQSQDAAKAGALRWPLFGAVAASYGTGSVLFVLAALQNK